MKKLFIILLFSYHFGNSQSLCVQVNCSRSIRLPQDSITLNALITPSTGTTTLWTLASGTGTITNATTSTAMVHGLTAGTNIFQLTAQTPTSTINMMDTVTVLPPCPVCPPQRTATKISISGTTATVTYSDNSTTTMTLKNAIVIQ